jgi:hypothetical protein
MLIIRVRWVVVPSMTNESSGNEVAKSGGAIDLEHRGELSD